MTFFLYFIPVFVLFLTIFFIRDPIVDIKKILSWDLGRQGTGYKKHTFFSSEKLKMDCHLLWYPHGTDIPPHKDPNPGGKHYRLNIVLAKPYKGGKFYCNRHIFALGQRVHFFRPDKYPHFVTPSVGERLVLSFGKVI